MNAQRNEFVSKFGLTYAQFAKKHGLHRDTIRWRWTNGRRTEKELTAAPNERTKTVCGKTFEQWSVWFAIRGIDKSAKSLQGAFWHYKQQGLSDKQCLKRMQTVALQKQKAKS